MCGICGIYHYKQRENVHHGALAAMNTVLTHRGPDDEGYHVEGSFGMAMRRLIIIDPETGHQPLYNEDRSVALVCNGEIYNFPSLRAWLIDKGHAFASRTDCEVIVHLYEEMGLGCVERLQGMFAFALWDRTAGRLVIARDRIGIKPLYYRDDNGTLVFGSEAKAVLANERVPRTVSPAGLHHFLSFNYVPAPFTLVEGLQQLLPGEFLACTADGAETRTYWDLRFAANESLGEREWASKVDEKLRDCVESHLVSDVPFGAFLSGGVDSSAVVGYMSQLLPRPVQTFSIDFEEKTYSEARFARTVAERFACTHHEMTVSPDVVELLEQLVWHADDPLADSSMIPVYLVSRFAREHVTMVLTGDGADEVFAGYDTYNAHFLRRYYRMLPAGLRARIVKPLVEALPVSLTKVSLDYKAKRFVSGAELDADDAHFWWRAIFSETEKSEVYSKSFKEQLSGQPVPPPYREYFGRSGTDDPLSRMLYADTRFYLPNDMLVKVDRMTMANALEARVPFLDHELVELAATIPSSIKFRRGNKKHILKRALAPMLPGEIINRKKAGFNVPINAWLAGELNAFARDILSRERLGRSGFFDVDHVQRLLHEHERKRCDHSYRLWGLMSFQLWYEMFIEPRAIRPPSTVCRRWGLRFEPCAENGSREN